MAHISTVPNFRTHEQLEDLRQRYVSGELLADEALNDVRINTTSIVWGRMMQQRQRFMRRKDYSEFLGKDIDISVKLDAILCLIMDL